MSPSKDWKRDLGKEIIVEGRAFDTKTGAIVDVAGEHIYLDGVDSWPDGFMRSKVRVTGVLIERYDLPVFVEEPGVPPKTGMPVPPGIDVKKASHRYLLSKAKWTKLGE